MTVLSNLAEIGNFAQPLSQKILNIEDKNRANLFAWRGQFSPQLIESLLRAYCPPGAMILDPFSGSGTTLYEAGCIGHAAYGFELNPAAWILSKTYQLMNLRRDQREQLIASVKQILLERYPEPELLCSKNNTDISLDNFSNFLDQVISNCTTNEAIFIRSMVILLNLFNKDLTIKLLYDYYYKLSGIILQLPYSKSRIIAGMADARSLPLSDNVIDFVLTSPPYINVFNYHQNYRRSAEVLGWNLLQIARSEIGSNRANRGNRFLTVIQYCIDMSFVLHELIRVCSSNARIILVIGHESNVLGVPFYNANIIENMARASNAFVLHQRQRREFTNKFGQKIREDLLHLSPSGKSFSRTSATTIARIVAKNALMNGISRVPEKNKVSLTDAINRTDDVEGTSILQAQSIEEIV